MNDMEQFVRDYVEARGGKDALAEEEKKVLAGMVHPKEDLSEAAKFSIAVMDPRQGRNSVTDKPSQALKWMRQRNAERAVLIMGKAQFNLSFDDVERLTK